MAEELAAVVVQADTHSEAGLTESKHDPWLGWLLTLAAVGLPVVVLLAADSIPRAAFAWHYVGVSIQRGDFLIPVLILCAEAVRRWWREVPCVTIALRGMRLATTAICIGCIVICLISTAIATSLPVSADIGKSVGAITVVCFIAALGFGTTAVIYAQLEGVSG